MAASAALLAFPHVKIQHIALQALLQPEVLQRLADEVDDVVSSFSFSRLSKYTR